MDYFNLAISKYFKAPTQAEVNGIDSFVASDFLSRAVM